MIGIYQDKIEILFDEPSIGGTNLHGRCSNFRGGFVLFFDIFNLSSWSKLLVNPKDNLNYQKNAWNGDYDIFELFKVIGNH